MMKEYKAILSKTLTQLNIEVTNLILDGWEPSGDLQVGEFPVKHNFTDREPVRNKYTGEYHAPYEMRNVRGYIQVMIRFED